MPRLPPVESGWWRAMRSGYSLGGIRHKATLSEKVTDRQLARAGLAGLIDRKRPGWPRPWEPVPPQSTTKQPNPWPGLIPATHSPHESIHS